MSSLRANILAMSCLVVLCPALVLAQGFEIVKLLQGGSAGPTREYFDPRIMADAFQAGLNRNRATMENMIKQQLGRGDLIARGVTLYDLNPRLGQATFRFPTATTFEATIKGNYLYFKSTTPTDLGKWADPAFELHFDLRFTCNLSLPTGQNPRVEATQARVEVTWAQIQARNVTGGVAVTAANIANFFVKLVTGRDMIRNAVAPYMATDVTKALNARLAHVNNVLAKLAADGYRIPSTERINDQLMKITMAKRSILGKFDASKAKVLSQVGKVGGPAQASDVVKAKSSVPDIASRLKLQQASPALQLRLPAPGPIGPVLK